MTTQAPSTHEIDTEALRLEAFREHATLECHREFAETDAARAGRKHDTSKAIEAARRAGRAEEAAIRSGARVDRLNATSTDTVREALDSALDHARVALIAARSIGADVAVADAAAALDFLERAAGTLAPEPGR